MKRVIVIGTGGHAKVVIDILSQMADVVVIGVTTLSLEPGTMFFDVPVLGNDEILNSLHNENAFDYLALGVGGFTDNNRRSQIFENFTKSGFRFINAVHPSAILSPSAKLGEGIVIFPGAILNTEVTIGNNTIIATGACIDHETVIGHNVLVSAGVTIGAMVTIDDNCLLALGSKVVSQIRIGHNSLIAAGAVVVSDIAANERVFGIPAKKKVN